MIVSPKPLPWRRTLAGVALALMGSALLLGEGRLPEWNDALRHTAGAILLAIGIAVVSTAWGQRTHSAALFRLDHFLPSLRRTKKTTPPSPTWVNRLARRILPAVLFADPLTGKPGKARLMLKRIGPTVLSSPVRRMMQALCLLLFLGLFFHVCWPYNARPKPPAQASADWQFAGIAEDSGQLHFKQPETAPLFAPGQLVHLTEATRMSPATALRVVASSAGEVLLEPVDALAPERLDELLFGTGPWTLHDTPPNAWPSHYSDALAEKEQIPADLFLAIDPLVSLSTAIASRSWVWSLLCAGIILLVCVLIPRGFCGYLCPLGTLIDLFDWAVSRRVQRFRVARDGWWVHIKYYLLLGTLVAAAFGVLVSGFVAAIPVITRGMLFIGEPLQTGVFRGWHLVAPMHWGHLFSIFLFLGVLALGFLRPRFWCKYVCPSGAVFSLANWFRVSERKVEDTCINCNKCVEICPFDAIKPDFTTRVTDCTLCQTCGGVCPTHSIKFVDRWTLANLKVPNHPPTGETALGRRGFISLVTGGTAAVAGGASLAGATKLWGARLDDPNAYRPVRPPGSVPEQEFLQMCIRCGECFKACPNNVLQPEGFEQGLEGLWAPQVKADWAGCDSSCNACGQVCPTGAIQPLPLEVKRKTRMALAAVDENACLPHAGSEACQLCVDDCTAAGYNAIEFIQVHTQTDSDGNPVEGTGFVAPVVVTDKCVGCGLCQTRCYGINVLEKRLLRKSAIVIAAGAGKEDRFMPQPT